MGWEGVFYFYFFFGCMVRWGGYRFFWVFVDRFVNYILKGNSVLLIMRDCVSVISCKCIVRSSN